MVAGGGMMHSMKFTAIRAGSYKGVGSGRYAYIERAPDRFWYWTVYDSETQFPFFGGSAHTLSEAKSGVKLAALLPREKPV